MSNVIKVMIIDDSFFVRQILTKELSKYNDIEIVGSASNPIEAKPLILKLKPNVIILDIEMPHMDGLTFLPILQKLYPVPVVVLSSLTEEGSKLAIEALNRGATEVMAKPSKGGITKLPEIICDLYFKIRASSIAKKRANLLKKIESTANILTCDVPPRSDIIIAIGSSTGGTEALRYIIPRLPNNLPPIIITQHMPPTFTASFARSLNQNSLIEVVECPNQIDLKPGMAVIAKGGTHLTIKKKIKGYVALQTEGEPVHYQKPSVDVMFESVAQYAGANSIGVILTGMGRDGADGMLKMKERGAYTIAQDEASCIVYGMPKAAAEIGAAQKIVPLEKIPEEIINAVKAKALSRMRVF